MPVDPKNVAYIVEIITREVLLALSQQELDAAGAEGGYCSEECAEGLCVRTCFDRVGEVLSAGAERVSSTIGGIPADLRIASSIDHTLLKPDATPDQIAQLCFEARKYGFASVCINPTHVPLSAELLQGSDVRVCTVIGFPLGATPPEVKVFETQQALRDGASEIDMVINIGALKARDYKLVARDIHGVVMTAHQVGALVKVIIEASLLTKDEKVAACLLAKEAGADFVKTSTGFSGGGATVEDVALMRKVVGPVMGVKAAGGIRTYEEAEQMVRAGATRIGASAGVKIVQAAGQSASPSAAPTGAAAKAY